MKECFSDPEGPFKNINEIWKDEESSKHFMFIMMHPGLNLYDYVYMRRFNNAMNNCNENEKIPPNRMFCALQITSPRTRRLSAT